MFKRVLLTVSLLSGGFISGCMADGDETFPVEQPRGRDRGDPTADPTNPPANPGDPPTPGSRCATDGLGEVGVILERECSLCHGATPQYGAPMSLAKYEDLTAPARSDPSRRVHQLVVERLTTSDAVKRMPPQPRDRLMEADLAMLRTWSEAGAPRDETCDEDPTAPPVQPPAMPPPVREDDPTLEPIDITAPMNAVRAGASDEYACFSMKVQTAHTLHAVKAIPIVASPEVVHHILLFRDRSGTYPAEKYEGCSADTLIRSSWELVHGWAPGGEAMEMPPAAGIRIEDGDQFVVQIHYNNPTEQTFIDTSGMRLLATPVLRENDAAVVGAGPELFVLLGGQQEVTWTGNCRLTQPMHIFGVNPHMHLLGRKAKLELIHEGVKTTLYERDEFSFDAQYITPLEAHLEAGDTLRTTCTWDTSSRPGFVFFGEKTTDEMCYVFVAHYPPIGEYSCN